MAIKSNSDTPTTDTIPFSPRCVPVLVLGVGLVRARIITGKEAKRMGDEGKARIPVITDICLNAIIIGFRGRTTWPTPTISGMGSAFADLRLPTLRFPAHQVYTRWLRGRKGNASELERTSETKGFSRAFRYDSFTLFLAEGRVLAARLR